MTKVHFLDEPPKEEVLTEYDRQHMKLYLRLLDADKDGANWQDAVEILFGFDPKCDVDRARAVHRSHLARAKWMTEYGYRDLVRLGRV